MPWKNLAEDLSEEFSEHRLDPSAEGFIYVGPADEENKKNYGRWYKKAVFYPKHREKILLDKSQWYRFHKLMQDDVWKKRLAWWKRHNEKAKTKGTPEYERKLAYMRKWKAKKYKEDEEYRNKRCAENRAAYARRVQSPEYREKLREYQRKYRAKKKADGQKGTSSS